MLLPVDHPGQEQKSQWLQIRRERPDYIFMWGWGVMNSVAIQEAANIRFPMENFIGVWWSGSENDVTPAGDAAHGYKSLAMHAPGDDFPVYDDMRKYVIDKGAKPVFANLSANSCPWAIPFYSASITERNSRIRWGLENNLPIFCWPSLPDMQIQKKEAAFEKWETVFCVELTCAPPK